jgi:hypothetical protein
MKKLAMLLLLAAAVPAMATITFTAMDNEDGTITIGYASDGADAPRAIALTVSLSDGATVDPAAGVVVESEDFITYMDYAYSAYDGGEGYEIGDGHPLAVVDAAGRLEAPASEFSICMGVLDEGGNQAPGESSDTLVTLTLDIPGESTTVSISADTLRGPDSGVVGDAEIMSVMPEDFVVGGSVCYIKPGHADYDDWVEAGEPECWCREYQCRGDADGNQFAGSWVFGPFDLDILVKSWNKNPGDDGYNVCADFDHRKFAGARVFGPFDLQILIDNWNKPVTPCE